MSAGSNSLRGLQHIEKSNSLREVCNHISRHFPRGFWRDRAGLFEALILPPVLYALLIAFILLLAPPAHAGGPEFVAGNTYFDSSAKGQAIAWAQGTVVYYTDQGDLSPLLPGPAADSFVADAFTRWTSVTTAALMATPNTAQYQLSVEEINTDWSSGVGPYAPWQVTPSGAAQPVVVTASKGGEAQQDLSMQGSTTVSADAVLAGPYDSPGPLPPAGDWTRALGTYGEADFFQLPGQAYRTLSVEVTALDDTGSASLNKARPMIGMWALADPHGTLRSRSHVFTIQYRRVRDESPECEPVGGNDFPHRNRG